MGGGFSYVQYFNRLRKKEWVGGGRKASGSKRVHCVPGPPSVEAPATMEGLGDAGGRTRNLTCKNRGGLPVVRPSGVHTRLMCSNTSYLEFN